MKPSRDAILSGALQLDADDRAVIVNRLLDSIHDQVSADIQSAWIEEAERRLAQYRDNSSAAQPLDCVVQQLRKRHS